MSCAIVSPAKFFNATPTLEKLESEIEDVPDVWIPVAECSIIELERTKSPSFCIDW